MKKFLVFICFPFLIFVVIGCSADETDTSDRDVANDTSTEEREGMESADSDGSELRIAYSAQPPSLDPQINQVIATSDIMRQVFEALLTVDKDYNIQPMLAESYEQSEDGKTVTFYLRQGVLFHNGEEMKADDVTASMNRWKKSLGSRAQFTDANFEAVDDYTVVMTLPEPLSTTLTALAYGGAGFAAIMPKEINEEAGAAGVHEYIGTGPFKFVEWKQDQYVHLTKFEDYQARTEPSNGLSGKKEALVNDVYFMFVSDSATRIAGLQTGEYDIAQSIPLDDVDQLEEDPSIETHVYPGSQLSFYFNKIKGLFTDVRAREALLVGLNMEDIMLAAHADDRYYTLNHNMMLTHQHEQWYSDIGKDLYNQNNTEKAKALLAEAGYNGEEITMITTREYESQYTAAVVAKEQMEQLGMNVKLEVYDWATLLDIIFDEDAYDLFPMGNFTGSDPTLNDYMLSTSAGYVETPEQTELIAKFRGQPTLEDAKLLYDDLATWFYEYIPAIKVGESMSVTATRSTIDNFRYQDGFILWNVSNDK